MSSIPAVSVATSPASSAKRFEAFFDSSIDNPAVFSRSLLVAVNELRGIELRMSFPDMLMNGDRAALNEINRQSLRPAQSAFEGDYSLDIAAHLKKVSAQWEQAGAATLYRGTRLPDPQGSFGFGVHATPQIDIAGGYASGGANSSTGIGRLFNSNAIGFIHAYDVSLDEKTYKNFQYEDALKDPHQAPTKTLRDLHQSMKALSELPADSFHVKPDDTASQALGQWQGLAGKAQHYEVVLDPARVPDACYFLHGTGLIKINAEDPRWDRLMARVQEASLRDFYEIAPLDRALQTLKCVHDRANGDVDKLALVDQVQQCVIDEKGRRMAAPWEATSLKDVALSGSTYLAHRPYIAQSERVGSAMEGARIVMPATVALLHKVCDSLQVSDYEMARKLIKLLPPEFDVASNAPSPLTRVAIEQPTPDTKTDEALLIGAMQLCAVNAGRQAHESVMRLNEYARVYATGQDTGRSAYESVSQAGYLAAYEVQTYGQTCDALGVCSAEQCEQLVAAGQNLFVRVQEHEGAYLSNALSPSAVFYDDLVHPGIFLQPHGPAILRHKGSASRHDEMTVPSLTD